jgi:uncharacterized protein (TIGR03085 family)
MAWVETERQSLGETLRSTDPAAPTLCVGWDARHLLAHLVQREHSPAASLGDLVVKREPGEERYLGRLADAAASPDGYRALTDRFLAGPPRWSPFHWAGESINLLEYVIHHEDLRRGAGPVPPRSLSDDESRAIWARLGVFGRLSLRKSPVGVRLAVPGGSSQPAHQGPDEVVVTGSPVELALVVSGRRRAASVEVSGTEVGVSAFERWAATS